MPNTTDANTTDSITLVQCKQLVQQLIRDDRRSLFILPVDSAHEELIDYYDIIKSPCDFTTILNKLDDNQYTSSSDVCRDIELIFSNARQYNRNKSTNQYVINEANRLHALYETKYGVLKKQNDKRANQSPRAQTVSSPIVNVVTTHSNSNTSSRDVAVKTELIQQNTTSHNKQSIQHIPIDSTNRHLFEVILQQLMNYPDSLWFIHPVDTIQFSDYLGIIDRPIDLSTIMTVLQSYKYHNTKTLYNDVQLVWKNCYKYNEKLVPVSLAAKQCELVWNQLFIELLDNISHKNYTAPTITNDMLQSATTNITQSATNNSNATTNHNKSQSLKSPGSNKSIGNKSPNNNRLSSTTATAITTSTSTTSSDSLRDQLQSVLKSFKRQASKIHHIAITDWFSYPVNQHEFPDYTSVVRYPIDLSTIEGKVRRDHYTHDTLHEFIRDIYIMLRNAMAYNESDSEIYIIAQKFTRLFDRILVQYNTLFTTQVIQTGLKRAQQQQVINTADDGNSGRNNLNTMNRNHDTVNNDELEQLPRATNSNNSSKLKIKIKSNNHQSTTDKTMKAEPSSSNNNQLLPSTASFKSSSAVPVPAPVSSQSTTVSSKLCIDLLNRLKHKPFSEYEYSWFYDPVDEIKHQAPDYYRIIKSPIHFSLITHRLSNKYYSTYQQFYDDVNLLFNNAKLYNLSDNIVHQTAVRMQNVFNSSYEKLMKQLQQDHQQPQSVPTTVKKQSNHDTTTAITTTPSKQLSSHPSSAVPVPDRPKHAPNPDLVAYKTELMNKLLESMLEQPYANEYSIPVSAWEPSLYTRYKTIIDQPIDLTTIYQSLQSGKYNNKIKSFISDMRLVFMNARNYWPIDDVIQLQIQYLMNELDMLYSELQYELRVKYDSTYVARMSDELYHSATVVVNQLLNDPQYHTFKYPVDTYGFGLTQYYDIITHPMSLTTIQRKINIKLYSSDTELFTDISYIWNNVLVYYEQSNGIDIGDNEKLDLYSNARELYHRFNELWYNTTGRQASTTLVPVEQVHNNNDNHVTTTTNNNRNVSDAVDVSGDVQIVDDHTNVQQPSSKSVVQQQLDLTPHISVADDTIDVMHDSTASVQSANINQSPSIILSNDQSADQTLLKQQQAHAELELKKQKKRKLDELLSLQLTDTQRRQLLIQSQQKIKSLPSMHMSDVYNNHRRAHHIEQLYIPHNARPIDIHKHMLNTTKLQLQNNKQLHKRVIDSHAFDIDDELSNDSMDIDTVPAASTTASHFTFHTHNNNNNTNHKINKQHFTNISAIPLSVPHLLNIDDTDLLHDILYPIDDTVYCKCIQHIYPATQLFPHQLTETLITLTHTNNDLVQLQLQIIKSLTYSQRYYLSILKTQLYNIQNSIVMQHNGSIDSRVEFMNIYDELQNINLNELHYSQHGYYIQYHITELLIDIHNDITVPVLHVRLLHIHNTVQYSINQQLLHESTYTNKSLITDYTVQQIDDFIQLQSQLIDAEQHELQQQYTQQYKLVKQHKRRYLLDKFRCIAHTARQHHITQHIHNSLSQYKYKLNEYNKWLLNYNELIRQHQFTLYIQKQKILAAALVSVDITLDRWAKCKITINKLPLNNNGSTSNTNTIINNNTSVSTHSIQTVK